MKTQLISGPAFVEAALFGIGLSYGLTSGVDSVRSSWGAALEEKLYKIADSLPHKQGGHNKFLEAVMFTLDVQAPRYWWQEFDTYRVGVTKQSESTMHTIMARELDLCDFEGYALPTVFDHLSRLRAAYLIAKERNETEREQELFLQMKQSLPENFRQRRIVCLNAKALQNMYMQRKNHRLPEWSMFFEAIRDAVQTAAKTAVECGCSGRRHQHVIKWIFGGDNNA